MRKFPSVDTGNGDPPPKKPPTEVPQQEPIDPIEPISDDPAAA